MKPGVLLGTGKALPWTAEVGWFTDMAVPHREALGLTSYVARCDRTAHRFRVTDPTEVMRWGRYARRLAREEREWLETQPGSRPAHWWVALGPVPVVPD